MQRCTLQLLFISSDFAPLVFILLFPSNNGNASYIGLPYSRRKLTKYSPSVLLLCRRTLYSCVFMIRCKFLILIVLFYEIVLSEPPWVGTVRKDGVYFCFKCSSSSLLVSLIPVLGFRLLKLFLCSHTAFASTYSSVIIWTMNT